MVFPQVNGIIPYAKRNTPHTTERRLAIAWNSHRSRRATKPQVKGNIPLVGQNTTHR